MNNLFNSATISDAIKAGYVLKTESNESGIVSQSLARISKGRFPRVLSGVRVYATGWAEDMTVDLSCAKHFRGDKAIRSILNLAA